MNSPLPHSTADLFCPRRHRSSVAELPLPSLVRLLRRRRKTGEYARRSPPLPCLGAALNAAHLHSLPRRQRCRLLQEEIVAECSSPNGGGTTAALFCSRCCYVAEERGRCRGNLIRRPRPAAASPEVGEGRTAPR
nr:hypothetical protein Iba_scaffold38702CG0010 [Ipomoea batatas]GME09531.1 hypothetical protein Iba_scaffold8881CG0040 [Ipomoea batatas]